MSDHDAEVERLRAALLECAEWLESRPDYTEGDAATASRARAALAGAEARCLALEEQIRVNQEQCIVCERRWYNHARQMRSRAIAEHARQRDDLLQQVEAGKRLYAMGCDLVCPYGEDNEAFDHTSSVIGAAPSPGGRMWGEQDAEGVVEHVRADEEE